MPHFLQYWRTDTVDKTSANEPVFYAGRRNLRRMGVAPRDTLWIVTSPAPGDLRLVGRIEVNQIVTSRRVAVRLTGGGNPWDSGRWAFGKRESSRPKQDISLRGIATKLTTPELPRRFTGRHLQAMRRLADPAVALLERAWAEATSRRTASVLSAPTRSSRGFVDTATDIRRNIGSFNDQAVSTPVRARNLLAQTTYWVHDVDTGHFGPAKFVGLKAMTLVDYEDKRHRVTGAETHKRIEAVLDDEFTERSEWHPRLRAWGHTLLGPEAFGEASQSKWRFVSLRPHDSTGSQPDGPSVRRRAAVSVNTESFAVVVRKIRREVTPEHKRYQARLERWLRARGTSAVCEQDFIDIQFDVETRKWIGEVKLATHLSRDEAFRSALGQLLFYSHVRFEKAPGMVMFLDHEPETRLLTLAANLGNWRRCRRGGGIQAYYA